jgi:Flp pilus assembly protein TadD
LLDDEVLSVRAAAANSLLDLPAELVSAADRDALRAAIEELRSTQLVNADRPEALVVLGSLHARSGELVEARGEYERALELSPASVPVRINLADLHRQGGDEAAAERLLREALAIDPGDADVRHALGLSLVRQRRSEEALEELARAMELAPESLRYGYVYAVAAQSTGRVPLALRTLEALRERWPGSREVLVALATYHAQMGGLAEAEGYARELVELYPQDPQARALLEQIRSSRG